MCTSLTAELLSGLGAATAYQSDTQEPSTQKRQACRLRYAAEAFVLNNKGLVVVGHRVQYAPIAEIAWYVAGVAGVKRDRPDLIHDWVVDDPVCLIGAARLLYIASSEIGHGPKVVVGKLVRLPRILHRSYLSEELTECVELVVIRNARRWLQAPGRVYAVNDCV